VIVNTRRLKPMVSCTNLHAFRLVSKMELQPSNESCRNSLSRKSYEILFHIWIYLDNVTVAGRDQEEHDDNVKSFLAAIRRRNFTLNESKTIVSQNDIHILGYVVGNGVVKPDPERMRALTEFPPPTGFNRIVLWTLKPCSLKAVAIGLPKDLHL